MEAAAGSAATGALSPASGIAAILAEVRREVEACTLCPGMRPWDKPRPPDPTREARYVLVRDAPPRDPAHDAAGRTLRDALRAAGDGRFRELHHLFRLAYAVRCVPPGRGARATRAPTRTECRNCWPYLGLEQRVLHPRVVLAFGAHAAESVLGRRVRILEEHDSVHRVAAAEVRTLISPSPYNRASLKRLDLTLDAYVERLAGLFATLIRALGA